LRVLIKSTVKGVIMLPSAQSLESQPVPDVIFKTRSGGEWRDVSSAELFKDKTVIVFSLPGAFTPTCSSSHLPRYQELATNLRENGVDEIICLAVNDAFVMEEWKAGQDAKDIRFIPDGNGDFTRGMGMLVDKRPLGFGMRSWRYSMLVRQGIIAKIFIEPEKEGDPYEVSDADTMLRYLNPEANPAEAALIFTRPGCPYCARAKTALSENGLAYTEITMSQHINTRALRAVSGQSTWPQVFVGGKLIGNAEALDAYFSSAGK
jgi:glutaredoxin-like protein